MWYETLADVLAEIEQDLYKVLGVRTNASLTSIKRAFRQRALQCHPDRHPEDPTCEERFKQAVAAFEVLSNPRLRARYDMSRGRHAYTGPEAEKAPHARGWPRPRSQYTRTDPGFWYEEPPQTKPPLDFESMPNVGPYMGVSFDATTTKQVRGPGRLGGIEIGKRVFRIIVYSAYNAFGLIGTEDNGVAILDEDYRRVLTDKIAPQLTGMFGPSGGQETIFTSLVVMPADLFREFVNTHPRSRYTLDKMLNPSTEK